MSKKITLALLAVMLCAVSFSSCSDDKTDDPIETTLKVAPAKLSFGYNETQQDKEVVITSNLDAANITIGEPVYDQQDDKDWLDILPEGKTIKIAVKSINHSQNERTATITVSGGGKSDKIEIVQEYQVIERTLTLDATLVSEGVYSTNVNYEANTHKVKVNTNANNVDVASVSSTGDWLSAEYEGGEIVFTVSENPATEGEARQGEIKISGDDVEDVTLRVIQGLAPDLDLDLTGTWRMTAKYTNMDIPFELNEIMTDGVYYPLEDLTFERVIDVAATVTISYTDGGHYGNGYYEIALAPLYDVITQDELYPGMEAEFVFGEDWTPRFQLDITDDEGVEYIADFENELEFFVDESGRFPTNRYMRQTLGVTGYHTIEPPMLNSGTAYGFVIAVEADNNTITFPNYFDGTQTYVAEYDPMDFAENMKSIDNILVRYALYQNRGISPASSNTGGFFSNVVLTRQ